MCQHGLGRIRRGGPRRPAAALADLVDRLGARLGVRRVRRLVPNDTHIPEFAVIAVPAAGTLSQRERVGPQDRGEGVQCWQGKRLPLTRIRPRDRNPSPAAFGGTLSHGRGFAAGPADPPFRTPEPIEAIAEVPDGPPLRFRWRRVMHEVASLEGPERIAPDWWTAEAPALSRDYFRVEDAEGQRFWLFREGLYGAETAHPRWYVHGLFA